MLYITAALALLGPAPLAQTDFNTQFTAVAGIEAFDLAFLDMDQDGDLDVAFPEGPDSILTALNLGNGQFAPTQELTFIGIFNQPQAIQAADLDGDGLEDVLCAANFGSKVSWWRSLGDGTFETEQRIGDGLNRTTNVVAADMDLDGDLDVLSTTLSERKLRFFENLGGGNFAPPSDTNGFPGSMFGISVGDLDGDSLPDVAVTAGNNPQVVWSRGNGDGTFTPPVPVFPVGGQAARLAIADMDGDGRNDIVATFFSGSSVVWFRGLPGGFQAPQVIDASNDGGFALDLADMDLDGDLDIAVSMEGVSKVRTYENLGNGAFGAPNDVHGFKEFLWGVKWIDMDGDFDPDIAAASRSARTITINENLSSIGMQYCGSPPNSTGLRSRFSVSGFKAPAQNEVVLGAADLPVGQFGVFMTSQTRGQASVPGANLGTLCLDGAIGFFTGPGEVQVADATGRISLRLNTGSVPQPAGFEMILPGSMWNFQAWHRDTRNGLPVSHFTQAIRVTFR